MNDLDGLIDYDEPDAVRKVAAPPVGEPAPAAPAPASAQAPVTKIPPPPKKSAPVVDDEDDEDFDEDDLDDDDLDDEEDENDGHSPAFYAFRRAAIKAVVFVLIAGVLLFVFNKMSGSPTSTADVPQQEREDAVTEAPTDTQMTDATATVQTVVDRAVAWQVQKESFVGFEADGARIASSESVLVVSMVIDGHCYYSGVIPGQEVGVLYDETSQACTDQMITETQTSLDTQVEQARSDSQSEAMSLLSNAVETVQYYASSNYVEGMPSFDGMDTTAIDGVTIVSNAGASVVLQAVAGDECLVTEVTHDSASEPVTADCQEGTLSSW